jgi:hypothetical protein
MIGTRLGLETGQYRLVHRLFDGLSSERECTPRDLDVIPAAGASRPSNSADGKSSP